MEDTEIEQIEKTSLRLCEEVYALFQLCCLVKYVII